MYIFLNTGLNMSTGKAAAQASHAAVEAYRISDARLLESWYLGGHYKKLVMEARDETHLLSIDRYIRARGFETELVIDEGFTEVPRHSITALGVEVVDKDDPHTAATFESFELLREKKVEPKLMIYEPKERAPRWRRYLTVFSKSTKDRNPA